MESEDVDRNRFVVDVTKTAFLGEGFSISRIGGSTADGANSPTARSEKSEKSKRGSSRPSSGKVGVERGGNGVHSDNFGIRREKGVSLCFSRRRLPYRPRVSHMLWNGTL